MNNLAPQNRRLMENLFGVFLTMIVLLGWTGANAAQEPWCFYDDPNLYYARTANGIDERHACEKKWAAPRTLPDELVLPMPCGRRMLFQRIDLEYSHVLDHRRIYMGREARAIDALRAGSAEAVVAGAFSCAGRPVCAVSNTGETNPDALKSRRVYYMGKYEVSALQYALGAIGAFETEKNHKACKETKAITESRGDRAATGMSWFEAVEFSRLYTEWLLREAPDALPKEQRTHGFLRLPTEAEWEYAARAHWSADPARQSEEGYPLLIDNLADNAGDKSRKPDQVNFAALWSRSAPPRPPRPGTGPANLFGLLDLAGGVAEMTMDLYRYRWLDGLPHGRAGGFVARGLISTQKARRADVHDRVEIPFYGPNGATRQKTLGFRLMIAAPVEVEGVDLKSLEMRIDKITTPGDTDRGAAKEGLDALIRAVKAGEVRRGDLERGLENIKTRLTQSSARLWEKEIESLRRRLVGLVLLAMNIDRQGRHAMAILSRYHANRTRISKRKDLSKAEKKAFIEKLKPTFEKYLDLAQGQEEELDTAFQFYLGEISELARSDIRDKDFIAALGEARGRLGKTRLSRAENFFTTIEEHIRQAHRTRGVIGKKWRTEWLYRLDSKRVRRDEVLDRKRK